MGIAECKDNYFPVWGVFFKRNPAGKRQDGRQAKGINIQEWFPENGNAKGLYRVNNEQETNGMQKRMSILPWLFMAMVAFLGANVVNAAETGSAAAPEAVAAPTIGIDKKELSNGGVIKVSGKAPAGKPVFLEVWSADHNVRASRFDSEIDKDSGKRPYIFYITTEMPSYYKTFVPKDLQPVIDTSKKQGKKWSYSALLKELGADVAYNVPAKVKTERYQSTPTASVVGSRGDLLEAMDDKESKKRSMQLVKARFQSIDKVVAAAVDVKPDGSYTATG